MIQKLSTLLLFVVPFSCSSRETPPNIVLIISDDQGFGDFGFTGNFYVSTPHLDALKAQSVYFELLRKPGMCKGQPAHGKIPSAHRYNLGNTRPGGDALRRKDLC
ncbi:MAG: sulfatase-like hydrolase/transferase [Bacteroidales bacterium]|nr:sulfatase-like hydrolase/transferase [Bacteroidales bacterium]